MTDDQRLQLIKSALEVRQRAHAGYSGFRVGAALLTRSGRIIGGCNVENASYGATICAERAAVCSAIAEGLREFEAIAIAASGMASPCGMCRQVLSEFCDDLEIVLVNANDSTIETTWLKDLFPNPFRRAD